MNDFLRLFLGQRDTGPIVVPYSRQEIEEALSAICPYDWHRFIETHVYQVNSKPPTDGLEAAGWRLVYNAAPNDEYFFSNLLPVNVFAAYSIGIDVQKDASIFDVQPGSPAYDAGLGPHMTILAVDGRAYSRRY